MQEIYAAARPLQPACWVCQRAPGDRKRKFEQQPAEANATLNALVGITLKPWRVRLELVRLTEFIANRHSDLRQTLLV